ncbi:MAG: hypothetical protein Q9174_000896 [Haloplaca sp. 1 TL-2023]
MLPDGYLPTTLPGANVPLASPPPGVTPNFVNPASNSFREVIAAAICIAIMLILTTIRVYAMVNIGRTAKYADLTFLLGAAWAVAYQGLIIGLLSTGLFGTHVWDLTIGDLENTPFLLVLITESLYGPFIWTIKLSMFLMYLHMFGTPINKHFRELCWGGIAVTGVFYFLSLVINLVLCSPRGGESYVMAFSAQRCARSKYLAVMTGVFNVISDLYLLLLPVRVVLGIHLALKMRLRLLAVFMTGIVQVLPHSFILFYSADEILVRWSRPPVFLTVYSTIEMTCGIFVLSAPALRVVFGVVVPRVRRFFAGSNEPNSAGVRGVGVPPNNGQRGQRASDDSGIPLQALGSAPQSV